MKAWQWIALAGAVAVAAWFVLADRSAAPSAPAVSTTPAAQSGPPTSVVTPPQTPTPPVLTSPWLAHALGLTASTTPVIRTPSTPGHQSAAGWYT